MSPQLLRGHTGPGNAQEGKQTFKTHFFRPYFDSEWPWRHRGVAVRPKITTPPRTSKCLPWGGGGCGREGGREEGGRGGGLSSPKYTCLLGYRLCLKRSEKKNKPRLPRIARHSNRTRCTAFPCVALVITAALTGDSRRERECVCMCLRQRCPAEEYLSFLFTLQLVVHFPCVMVNLDSHVWRPVQV